VYVALSGVFQAALGHSRLDLMATLLAAPLSAVFLIWSGWVLSAKRIARRELVPFALLGSALLALYSIGGGLCPASVQHVRDPLCQAAATQPEG
jgi:hypothetical protein